MEPELDHPELDHKEVRFHRQGGARSIILPAAWLKRIGMTGDVVRLTLHDGWIAVEPVSEPARTIEDDPAFPIFLDFLLREAMVNPDTLTNAADVLAEDEDLVPADGR